MPFNARCWMGPRGALAAVMILLTACAGVGSEAQVACPPHVDYSRAEQPQVAEEVAALPEGVRIVDWLADYAVLREQISSCF